MNVDSSEHFVLHLSLMILATTANSGIPISIACQGVIREESCKVVWDSWKGSIF